MKQFRGKLGKNEVWIFPTDTLYGLVGRALSITTVRRIYLLRKRNPKKPMIILIGDMKDIGRFGVRPTSAVKKVLKKVWPGKVSVVLPIGEKKSAAWKKFRYLHRGTGTLAFRLPKSKWLRDFLKQTGPLVAPSANFEGEPPAKTIRGARKYFGDRADRYVDAGRLASRPSTLIKVEKDGKVSVLRKGAVSVKASM